MTKGKLRNVLRKRFIELHIDLIREATEAMNERHKNGLFGKMSDKEKEIAELMRNKIGYSCKTNDCDLVWAPDNVIGGFDPLTTAGRISRRQVKAEKKQFSEMLKRVNQEAN